MDQLIAWKSVPTIRWAQFWLYALLGGILIFSALEHQLNPYQFVNSIGNYSIVPEKWNYWIAFFLPTIQLMSGVLLFSRTFRLEALGISTSLFAVFSVVQSSAYLRGLDVECGCFGSQSASVSGSSLGFVVSLLIISGCLTWLECISQFNRHHLSQ